MLSNSASNYTFWDSICSQNPHLPGVTPRDFSYATSLLLLLCLCLNMKYQADRECLYVRDGPCSHSSLLELMQPLSPEWESGNRLQPCCYSCGFVRIHRAVTPPPDIHTQAHSMHPSPRSDDTEDLPTKTIPEPNPRAHAASGVYKSFPTTPTCQLASQQLG